MFCTKCGMQNPEESIFCNKCGSALLESEQTSRSAQPSQNVPSVRSGFNAGQPAYGQQPQQFRQPYGAPGYTQTAAPKKSYMAVPIVIAVAAVLAAFLVVLFVVIIPNAGSKNISNNVGLSNDTGIEKMLKHKWLYEDIDGGTQVYDFVLNTVTVTDYDHNSYEAALNWSVKTDADGRYVLSINIPSYDESFAFFISTSDDGRKLLLKNVEDPSGNSVLTRCD